jgi:hypothetical protein
VIVGVGVAVGAGVGVIVGVGVAVGAGVGVIVGVGVGVGVKVGVGVGVELYFLPPKANPGAKRLNCGILIYIYNMLYIKQFVLNCYFNYYVVLGYNKCFSTLYYQNQ